MHAAAITAILTDDLDFALNSGEFYSERRKCNDLTPALRYVAAINPELTRKEFVEGLATVGYHPNTLTKQFGLSRKFDAEDGAIVAPADGRITNL